MSAILANVQVSEVAACGTEAGYRRHYRADEPRCQPCKDAANRAVQLRKAGQIVPREVLGIVPLPMRRADKGKGARELAPCGTFAAVKRHRARREELDEACRDAERAFARGRHARRKAARPKPPLPASACEVCGEEFTPGRRGQLRCGPVCSYLGAEIARGRYPLVVELRYTSPDRRAEIMARLVGRLQDPVVERKRERYGSEHVAERRRRLDERGRAARCARGGELLPEDESLIDLDHLDGGGPRDYLGLSCQSCNRGRRPVVEELLAS